MAGINKRFLMIPGDSHGAVLANLGQFQVMILRMMLKLLLNLIMKRKIITHGMPGTNKRFLMIPEDNHGAVKVSLGHQQMPLRMKLNLLHNKMFKKKTIIHGIAGTNKRFPTIPEDNHGVVLANLGEHQQIKLRMIHKLLPRHKKNLWEIKK